MKKTSILILFLASISAFAGVIIDPPTFRNGFNVGPRGVAYGNGGGLTNIPLNAATGTVANVSMPTNFFGEMRINSLANHGSFTAPDPETVLRNVTNWNESVSYGCTLSTAKGYITNNVAGYWTVTGTLNFGASDVENYNVLVTTNDVAITSSLANATVGAAGYIMPCPFQITLYLPANTRVSVGAYTDVATQTGVIGSGTFKLSKQ